MNQSALLTYHAPAERSSPKELVRQRELFAARHCSELLEAMSALVLVLNVNRQIVFASLGVMEMLQIDDPNELMGMRPGEAMGCVHSCETKWGCGTTRFCRACGAVKAILGGLGGKITVAECHMLREEASTPEALDLLVSAVPYRFDGEIMTVVTIADISHEVRRKALERIFFHDILNIAGGMQGMIGMLENNAPAPFNKDINLVGMGLGRLIEEIRAQKELTAAENNELTPRYTTLRSRDMLRSVVEMYRRLNVSRDKTIEMDEKAADAWFISDPTLLSRVLGNMVKNALEASKSGNRVTLGASLSNGGSEERIDLWVHNHGAIPKKDQLRIFSRSFSTKGRDRGLGTYSIKLISERYLDGQVAFRSSEDHGTTFRVSLPMSDPREALSDPRLAGGTLPEA